jgi:pentatricopeptide repeat protein
MDLVERSGHGIGKIKRIKHHWLIKSPDAITLNTASIKHLLFDGTYFKHENCLMVAMDNAGGNILVSSYCLRENYEQTLSLLKELASKGINPVSVTIDGNLSVIRAIRTVYPNIVIQRCLVHIQRQGLSWLRRFPKNEPAKELRKIFLVIPKIKSEKEKDEFIIRFKSWEKKYGETVLSLPSDNKVFGDLQRARSLIIHALPDMFHYLEDRKIPHTTNKLEGYFSILKTRYRQHRGMSKRHRENYFKWYIYFRNMK